MKFLTEGKRINRVPSKISMPPNIASGTLIRTFLKALFLYTVSLGQRFWNWGKTLSMGIMLWKFARQFIFHIVVPFFGTCIASLFDNTALVSASAPINTVVYPENFEWFLFVHCLNVCCKAITRISFHKTSMFCDCSDLFAFFYNINKFLIFEQKKLFFLWYISFTVFFNCFFFLTFPTTLYWRTCW